jgi:hypothetical protein
VHELVVCSARGFFDNTSAIPTKTSSFSVAFPASKLDPFPLAK